MNLFRMLALGIFGVSLILASVLLVDYRLDAQQRAAQAQRDDVLMRAAQVEIERTRSDELRLRARLLAADGALIAYIADALQVGATPGEAVDSASIGDLLAERREQLGFDAVGVIDVAGRFVAGTRPWSDGGPLPLRHPLFVEARDSQRLAIGLVREDRRLFLASIQPMVRAGTVDAYLYAADALDAAFLQALARLLPIDLALLATSEPTQLLVQSGDINEAVWLASAADGSGSVGAAAGIGASASTVTVLPLFGRADQALLLGQAGRPPGPSASLSTPLALLAALWALLWLSALYAWWRSALQPATLACDLLERAALGDFKLRAPPWPAGLRGRFAAAFDTLMLRLGSR